MNPTSEQQYAIDCARSGRTLALEALAGSGKSSTLKMIAGAVPASKRILLTAFSAQVIADAKAAGFGRNVRVSSNHGLAFGPVGAAYREAGRMERRLTPRVVVECLGLSDRSFPGLMRAEEGAHLALEAVLRFQSSAARELTPRHVRIPGGVKDNRREVEAVVFKTAQAIWAQLSDLKSSMPISHDTYLKLWALSNPRINAELLMIDEAQDANPTVIDVLTKQDAQLIIVGDRFQQIFSFRGPVNAMSSFEVQERAWLTQSFRFGNAIAQAANAVMAAHLQTDVRIRGNPAINDRIGTFDAKQGPYTIVARKNASLIGELFNGEGRIGVVGGVGDLRKLVEGADKLMRKERALTCPDLADFATWSEVQEYANTDAGRDLSVLVRLVDQFGTYRLEQALKAVDGNERDEDRCDLLLTTAHRSKGRQWPRVMLADDFPPPTDADLGVGEDTGEKSKWEPEEANLLYVAATRAQHVLNIEHIEAWQDALDRCLINDIPLPGITDNPRFNPDIEEGDEEEGAAESSEYADQTHEDEPAPQGPLLTPSEVTVAKLYLMATGAIGRKQDALDWARNYFARKGITDDRDLITAIDR